MKNVGKKHVHMKKVKLSEIVKLSDDVMFYGQEAGCLWLEEKYIKEQMKKRNEAHAKLVGLLKDIAEHRNLEIDI